MVIQINGYTDRWLKHKWLDDNRWTVKMDGQMDRQNYRWLERWLGICIDSLKDGYMGGQTDGCVDVSMVGWIDE